MRILVILPTYNEACNIRGIAESIIALRESPDILIIDDDSTDGTKDIVRALVSQYAEKIFLMERAAKLGLGSAYIAGFKFALDNSYEYVFEMDADLSHDSTEIPNFMKAMEGADLVVGSRYSDGIRIMNWPLRRLVLSYTANVYARWMSGLHLTDCTSGYKCFSRKALEVLPIASIVSNGYSFQIEVNFLCYRLGLRIKEIPIVFTERKFGSSKMSKAIASEAFFLGFRLLFQRINIFRR